MPEPDTADIYILTKKEDITIINTSETNKISLNWLSIPVFIDHPDLMVSQPDARGEPNGIETIICGDLFEYRYLLITWEITEDCDRGEVIIGRSLTFPAEREVL